MLRLVPKGKPRSDRSSGVSDCRRSRDRGPMIDSTPMPEVTLVSTHRASASMCRCSQLKSLISVSAPVTMRYSVRRKPRHGQIRLDPAALVQPLRVDDPARAPRPRRSRRRDSARGRHRALRGGIWRTRIDRTAPRRRGRCGARARSARTSSGGRSCTRRPPSPRPARTSWAAPSRTLRRSRRPPRPAGRAAAELRTPRAVAYWRKG